MNDISYGIGLIIGYLIPIMIVAFIASGILKMTVDKFNGITLKYSKALLLIFIAYLISFVIGGNLGEAINLVGFTRILLICFIYSVSISVILYFFLEISGEKLGRKELVIHTSLQTLTVFAIVTSLLIIVS